MGYKELEEEKGRLIKQLEARDKTKKEKIKEEKLKSDIRALKKEIKGPGIMDKVGKGFGKGFDALTKGVDKIGSVADKMNFDELDFGEFDEVMEGKKRPKKKRIKNNS